jgi:peptide/nickel transport system permease protein
MKSVRHFLRNRELVVGCLVVLGYAIIALAAPLIAPPGAGDPYRLPTDTSAISVVPNPPVSGHPLGTLAGNYDIFYGIIWGSRIAFQVGLSITLGRALIGTFIGLLAGYYRGFLDGLLMRITDAFTAFPIVAAALVMILVLSDQLGGRTSGPQNSLSLALVLFGWMRYARLVRGNVMTERAKEYIAAAVAVGARQRRVLIRHILPNVSTKGLLVLLTSDIGAMVVIMAMFRFLGLLLSGREQPLADWGQMLAISRSWMIPVAGNPFQYWFVYAPTALTLILFSVGWNLIGDGLTEAFDPRAPR